MKKIMASVLCVIMIFGLFNTTIINAASLTQDQLTLLELTGVLDRDENWDKTLSKGEFAQIVAKVAFALNADVKNYVTSKVVTDVDSNSKYYDAVNALYGAGYLPVDKFGMFYPDEKIDLEAASEIILRTMGYSEKTIPDTYTYSGFALKKGIMDGVSQTDGEISLFNVYKMIYNMLQCDITDLKFIKYDSSSNKLIYMTTRLMLYSVKGLVTDDGVNSLYGESELSEGYIKIEDSDELVNDTGRADLFGLNIVGYFVYDKEEREYHLLDFYENEGKNNITIINSDDIEEYTDRTYYYYQSDYAVKSSKIKVPKDVIIVYNGKTLTLEDNFDNTMYCPKNGIVKLYDNDGDGSVDILFIDNYSTYIVQLYNSDTESIYVKDEKPLLNMRDKEYSIQDQSGNSLTLTELVADSVISVAQSLDGEFYKILVSTYTQTDTVVSYNQGNDDEKAYVMTESGGKYIMNNYTKENNKTPELGVTYKFYFDAFDKVVDFEKDVSSLDWQMGYLVWIRYMDDMDDEVYGARIFDSNGEFYTYILNKTLRVLDENDDWQVYSPEVAQKEVSYYGIVRYKINNDELLTHIEIPHKYGEKPTTDDRLFYLVDTINTDKKEDYYTKVFSNTINFGGAAIVNQDTKVFAVPAEKSDYYEYEIGNYSSFENGKYYSLYMFGTDYRSKNAVCACLSSADAADASITNETPETVVNVNRVFDEENNMAVYAIECVNVKGVSNSYYMEEEDYETEVKCIASGNLNPVKLDRGDIIYLNVADNYITKAVLVYDASQIVKDEKGNDVEGAIAGTEISYYSETNTLCSPFVCGNYTSGNPGNASSWKYYSSNVRIWSGWVYSYENGYMVITNQNPAYGYDHNATKENGLLSEAQYFSSGIATTIHLGSKGRVQVTSTTEGDIKPYNVYGADCSRVVVTQRVYDQRSIHIINDE